MLTTEFAHKFSADWIAAWNAHDPARVLELYSDDFEMSSPYIAKIVGDNSGILKGKNAAGNYWRMGLAEYPELKFIHETTLVGAHSITIIYKGAKGLAAEVFFFNDELKVIKTSAHYLQK